MDPAGARGFLFALRRSLAEPPNIPPKRAEQFHVSSDYVPEILSDPSESGKQKAENSQEDDCQNDSKRDL